MAATDVYCGTPSGFGSGGRQGRTQLNAVLRNMGFPEPPFLQPNEPIVLLGEVTFCSLTRHPEGSVILWNLRTRSDVQRRGLASLCVKIAAGFVPTKRMYLAVEPEASPKEQERLQRFYSKLGFLSSDPPRGQDSMGAHWMMRPSCVELILAQWAERGAALNEGATASVDESARRLERAESAGAELCSQLDSKAPRMDADGTG